MTGRIVAYDERGNPVREEQVTAYDANGHPAAWREAPPPSARERDEVARRAMQRHLRRSLNPLGGIVDPFVEGTLNPRRRQEAANAVTGAAGWLAQQAQQPLDLERLGRDTMEAGRNTLAELPQLPGRIWNNAPSIVRALTYGPGEDSERASLEQDLAELRGDEAAANEAAGRGNAATLQQGVNIAAPALGGGSAVRAGLTAAGIDLPFALARGEGDLQERLPNALTEAAGIGLFGAGLQGAANALPAVRIAPQTANIVERFDEANVPPIYAAARGREAAPWTMAIAENPFGGNVRANLERSAQATGAEAARIAGEYSPPPPMGRESAGEVIQGGIQRWANPEHPVEAPMQPDLAAAMRRGALSEEAASVRNAMATPSRLWSFDTKADTLYSNVSGRLQAMEDAAIAGQSSLLGGAAELTTTHNARRVLNDILGSVRNPSFRRAIADPDIAKFAQLVEEPGRVHFGDLRAFRSYVRGLQQTHPQLRRGLDDAGLQRLESALTDDIAQSARNIGGPRAEHLLRRIDTFYRAGHQRIARALQPFASARSPAGAYDRIIQLASDSRASANSGALLSLKRTLRPAEFRSVQASIINRLGRVRKGAADALEEGAFSIENFVSNYADMTPQARRILFGSRGGGATDDLAAALDNLAYVAGRQKAVRGFTNFSRSGSSVQNMGTLAVGAAAVGRAFMGDLLPALELVGGVVGMRVMGEALTNPRFVRWMVGASRARASAGSMAAQLPKLAAIAAADPAVGQIYNELVRQQERGSAAPSPAAPAQTEPAL